jgi:hypothetical protein
MARASTTRDQEVAPGVGAGERWGTRRGGSEVFLDLGPNRRRRVIGVFHSEKDPSAVDHERAVLAAQAPRMYEALLNLVSKAREDGFFTAEAKNPVHRVGCECGICAGLLAIALAEGGGRCILCGCTEFDACEGGLGEGCAWVDREQFLCSAHPAKMIEAARRSLLASPAPPTPEARAPDRTMAAIIRHLDIRSEPEPKPKKRRAAP